MAHQIKMLAIKPSDLSSIPKIHMVERTNSPKFCSDLHIQAVAYIVKKEKLFFMSMYMTVWLYVHVYICIQARGSKDTQGRMLV